MYFLPIESVSRGSVFDRSGAPLETPDTHLTRILPVFWSGELWL
jgi:hypothetical protein